MKITLCSSTKFFNKLVEASGNLKKFGHEIFLPNLEDYHHLEEKALAKIHHDLIHEHFEKINNSHAIYVANHEKNGIRGYIGGNTFLEIGMAFYKKIPIYLFDEIPDNIGYREELVAMQPIVVGEDWQKLDEILKIHYKTTAK